MFRFLYLMLLFAAPALAECKDKNFGSKIGDLYLAAENLLFTEENHEVAIEKLSELRQMKLNCYEFKHVSQLSAAALFRAEQYLEAAQVLEELVNAELLEGEGLLRAFYQIAQIYLQEEELQIAKEYLDKWLKAGAEPDTNQYMQLASLHHKLGDNLEAARFLEIILSKEAKPAKNIIDFVIYVYNETEQKKKLADFLRNTVIPLYPEVKKYWEVSAGLYFEADDESSAFEVIKAMYLTGFLLKEDEIMRVVNFYNQLNAPFAAAKVMAAEMERERIEKSAKNLETLASLLQVAREYEAAIPVLHELAKISASGKAYERLGRSYFEMGEYAEASTALEAAIEKKDTEKPGDVWALIGRALHQLDKRDQARQAFLKATKYSHSMKTAQAWLAFMHDEDVVVHAQKIHRLQVRRDELSNIKNGCDRVRVLGKTVGELPAECNGIETSLASVTEELRRLAEQYPDN